MGEQGQKDDRLTHWLLLVIGVGLAIAIVIGGLIDFGTVTYSQQSAEDVEGDTEEAMGADESQAVTTTELASPPEPVWPVVLDRAAYDERLLALAEYTPPPPIISTSSRPDGTVATTTEVITDLVYSSSSNVTVDGQLWPPAAPYPHGDAILPFSRILAYYGNFYSTRMGILGEYEPAEVLRHLRENQAQWEAADPTTPVLPAIQYIAMVAQADAGADGMYRAVMPDAEIEKAYQLANEIDGILILDLQVGKSTIEKELPKFRSFLMRPEVHLAIDPEFSMKSGHAPGKVIGTFDAADINYVIEYLAEIVRSEQLPPKVLVVHRFTQNMVTRTAAIEPQPEVQVIMHMDGWGSKELKHATYRRVIEPEPVQFTGVKIFYKNDLKPPSTGLLSPTEVLELNPTPIYMQYQ